MLNLTPQEIEKLKNSSPISTIIKLLEQAQRKAGYSSPTCFDKFLDFGIGALKVMPIQLCWDKIRQDKTVDCVQQLLAAKSYAEMLEFWQTKVIAGLDDAVIELFTQAVAVLNYHALNYLAPLSQLNPFGIDDQPSSLYKHPYAGIDILGELYMRFLVSRNSRKYKGQFFTSYHLARLMAEMLLVDINNWSADKSLSLCEPSCGSGVMVLAFYDVLRTRRPDLVENGLVRTTMLDIDATCTKMVELNCLLYRIPMYTVGSDGQFVRLVNIVCGNALSLDWLNPKQKAGLAEQQKQQMLARKEVYPAYQPTPPIGYEQSEFDRGNFEFKNQPKIQQFFIKSK
jgi:type I restriction-modification system DNA methylase subunit